MTDITYSLSIEHIDWVEMKELLKADDFDNGRTPEQYKKSAENSHLNCFAFADGKVIGNIRVLSDGVCNAYIVDVWTYTPYRRQGVARTMMQMVMEKLQGQHICLVTDKRADFYTTLGFTTTEVAMEKVVGQWLQNETST